jgi:hypothetical protein
MENKFFFPQDALDRWIVDEVIDLIDGELTVLGEGRRYRLAEAVRILREVPGSEDPHELVGLVKERARLEQLGAEIVQTSMLLGEAAYDVQPGWVGVPVQTEAEPSLARERTGERTAGRKEDSRDTRGAKSDEEVLARLAKSGRT